MLIVKTMEEAKQATIGFNTVYFNMQKKTDASTIHEGHNKSLEAGKAYGNKTVVGFWYTQALLNYISDKWLPEPILDWDSSGCVAWAESQNVDIVWAPEYIDEIAIFQIDNLLYYKGVVNKAWEEEGYEQLFSNPISSEKTKLICLSRLITNTGWKYTFSWKDGITRFVEKHFMEKYINSKVIITNPIKSPEGVYYSSAYFKYSNNEKIIMAQLESVIKSFDFSKDIMILKDNIESIGQGINLVVQHLKVTTNDRVLGPNKKLVDIKTTIGKDENQVIEKNDMFAVYV
jgi:hypothetical protein